MSALPSKNRGAEMWFQHLFFFEGAEISGSFQIPFSSPLNKSQKHSWKRAPKEPKTRKSHKFQRDFYQRH